MRWMRKTRWAWIVTKMSKKKTKKKPRLLLDLLVNGPQDQSVMTGETMMNKKAKTLMKTMELLKKVMFRRRHDEVVQPGPTHLLKLYLLVQAPGDVQVEPQQGIQERHTRKLIRTRTRELAIHRKKKRKKKNFPRDHPVVQHEGLRKANTQVNHRRRQRDLKNLSTEATMTKCLIMKSPLEYRRPRGNEMPPSPRSKCPKRNGWLFPNWRSGQKSGSRTSLVLPMQYSND
mmetsp:Transcript_45046/g.109511  ORF Transcript_45046/g.109511 Transcript_45046/m.109511 type:complete len:230 (-) Transcript_45046:390-1079(-)